uniref:Iwr1 domain-containing protein n=1 Tax=Globodera pallida TaxID=36090 RepID=A0A183BJF6_GLOPA
MLKSIYDHHGHAAVHAYREQRQRRASSEVITLGDSEDECGVTNANNAVKAPEKQEQSSLAMPNPSVDVFGPFEPTIVGYSEAFDEEDTSGSDFDLDFTEGEQDDDYSDYGEYFEDFDAFRADDPLALGNDYIGTAAGGVPESVMVH